MLTVAVLSMTVVISTTISELNRLRRRSSAARTRCTIELKILSAMHDVGGIVCVGSDEEEVLMVSAVTLCVLCEHANDSDVLELWE